MDLPGDSEAAEQLATIIDVHRAEIEGRWLQRVKEEMDRNGAIELTQLRDGIPDYLRGIVAMLKEGHQVPESAALQVWQQVAREHGVTRVRIGFDIGQLVREFVVLRHVIRDIALERGDVLEAPEAILADILDAAIAEAVRAYVQARDHEARRKQGEHIGFLTHELRNPLGTATLTASQLRRDLGPEHSRSLDRLERSHQRLSELIESVLQAEKIDAGQFRTHPVHASLGRVLDGALDTAEAAATAKGLAFRASFDPEIDLHVDPLLTRSAVQNVAENAVKYTDHGWVDIMIAERPEHIVIHVRDSCAGITAGELSRIFEPFERGQTEKAGTGLGLAIARRAIEAQGGSVGAESPGPVGCHFWIVLPKRVEARAQD